MAYFLVRNLRTITHQNAIVDEISVNKMSMNVDHLGVLDSLMYGFWQLTDQKPQNVTNCQLPAESSGLG